MRAYNNLYAIIYIFLNNENSLGFQFFTASSVVVINELAHVYFCRGDFICKEHISKGISGSKAPCILNLIDVLTWLFKKAITIYISSTMYGRAHFS